jgi:uncharacterized protein (TIGR03435 family)
LTLAVGWLALASTSAIGQTAAAAPTQNAKPLQFDVVSVKLNKTDSPAIVEPDPRPDGFTVVNMPIKHLLGDAYGIRDDLISGGPSWLVDDHYDVEGKVTSFDSPSSQSLSEAQRTEMIRSLLADRFKLVVHIETKELPVYELIVDKNGPKLKESSPDQQRGFGGRRDEFRAWAVTIPFLAERLSVRLQRTVMDKTGLTGKYDFDLKWDPGQTPAPQDGSPSTPSGEPSLFSALQEQLGLKLVPTKGPVQTLVIEHVERPSEN